MLIMTPLWLPASYMLVVVFLTETSPEPARLPVYCMQADPQASIRAQPALCKF